MKGVGTPLKCQVVCLAVLLFVTGCAGEGPGPRPAPSAHEPVARPASPSGQPVQPQEITLPPSSFRPDLLLILSKARQPGEVYGYELSSGKLEQLTVTASPEGAGPGAWGLAVSPDGRYFAYLRRKSMASYPPSALGLCVRPIQGGAPICHWGEMGLSLDWRPGTDDIWVHDTNTHGKAFRWGGDALEVTDPPIPVGLRVFFTADGRYAAYDPGQGSMRLADLSRLPVQSVEVLDFKAKWGPRAVADGVRDRRMGNVYPKVGDLRIVEVTGGTTSLPPSPNAEDEIQRLYADPVGRYLAVNYGYGSPVRFSGSTLYDRETGQWRQVPGRSLGWTPRTHRLLLRTDRGLAYYLPQDGQVAPLNFDDGGSVYAWSSDEKWVLFAARDQKTQVLQWRLHRVSTGDARALDFAERIVGEDQLAFVPLARP